MSDFLGSLLARNSGKVDLAQPRLPAFYEPHRRGAGLLSERARQSGSDPEQNSEADTDGEARAPEARFEPRSDGHRSGRSDEASRSEPAATRDTPVGHRRAGSADPASPAHEAAAPAPASPGPTSAFEEPAIPVAIAPRGRVGSAPNARVAPEASASDREHRRRGGQSRTEVGSVDTAAPGSIVQRKVAPQGPQGFEKATLPSPGISPPRAAMGSDSSDAWRAARGLEAGAESSVHPPEQIERRADRKLSAQTPNLEWVPGQAAARTERESARPDIPGHGSNSDRSRAFAHDIGVGRIESDTPSRVPRTESRLAPGRLDIPGPGSNRAESRVIAHGGIGRIGPDMPPPAAARRAASRKDAAIQASLGENQAAPAVRITIGRVEVRAVFPEPPARRPPARSRPTLSLDDYLKQNNPGR
jgi:hypothetical protein